MRIGLYLALVQLLLTLTVVWAVTSSALRALPMAMFSKYLRAEPARRVSYFCLCLASALQGRLHLG